MYTATENITLQLILNFYIYIYILKHNTGIKEERKLICSLEKN